MYARVQPEPHFEAENSFVRILTFRDKCGGGDDDDDNPKLPKLNEPTPDSIISSDSFIFDPWPVVADSTVLLPLKLFWTCFAESTFAFTFGSGG